MQNSKVEETSSQASEDDMMKMKSFFSGLRIIESSSDSNANEAEYLPYLDASYNNKDYFQNTQNFKNDIEIINTINQLASRVTPQLLRKHFEVAELIERINNNKFNWDNFSINELVDDYKLFTRSPHADLLTAYSIGDLFCQVFTPKEIMSIFEQSYPKIGGCEGFNNSIRVKTALIRGYYSLTFLRSLSYYNKIDVSTIFITEPFQRCRIRDMNQNNEKIKQIWSSDDFNLKNFIKTAAKEFLPQANYRWIEEFEYGILYVFLLIEKLFEYGIYLLDDLEDIANEIANKVPQILVLEQKCYFDIELGAVSDEFGTELKYLFQNVRTTIANICIHIITLYIDISIINSSGLSFNFSFFQQKFHQKNELIYGLFVQEPKLGSSLAQIIFRYVSKENISLEEQGFMVDLLTEDVFSKLHSTILPIILMEEDNFTESINLVQPEYIEYCIHAESEFMDIRNDVQSIKNSMIKMVEKCATNPQTIIENAKNYKKLFDNIKSMLDQKSAEENNQRKLFNIQTILAEENVINMVVFILRYSFDKLDKKTQEIIDLTLISLCKNNHVAQSKLFDEFSYSYLVQLLEHIPQRILYIFSRILEENIKIIQIGQALKKSFLLIFENKIKKINPNENRVNINDLKSLSYLARIFEKYISSDPIDTNDNKKLIQTKFQLQKILYDFIIKHIIPFFQNTNNFFKGTELLYGSQPLDINEIHDDSDESIQLIFRTDVYYSLLQLFHESCSNLYFLEIWRAVAPFYVNDPSLLDAINLNSSKLNQSNAPANYLQKFEHLSRNRALHKFYFEFFMGYSIFIIFPQNHVFNDRTPWNKLRSDNIPQEKSYFDVLIHDNIKILTGLYENLFQFVGSESENMITKFNKSARVFIFPIMKLFKGLIISNEILRSKVAENWVSQLNNLIQVLKHNLSHLKKIINIPDAEFPTLFNTKDWEKLDSSKLESVEKNNEKVFELRVICCQIFTYLEPILYENDLSAMNMLNRELAKPLSYYTKLANDNSSLVEKPMKVLQYKKNGSQANKFDPQIKPFLSKSKKQSSQFEEILWNIQMQYIEAKKKAHSDIQKNNFFRHLLIKNSDSLENLISLCQHSIKRCTCKGFDDEKTIIQLEFMQSLSILRKLFHLVPEFRNFLFEKGILIKRNDGGFWILDILYYTLRRFFSVVFFKTFHDDHWKFCFDYFSNATGLLQSLCKQNFHPFKILFGEREFKIQPEQSINILKDCFAICQMIASHMPSHDYTDNDVIITEKPELIPAFRKLLELSSEMISGSCTYNLKLINLEGYSLIQKIIIREIGNCNSPFYEIKQCYIRFIHSFIEDNNKNIITYFENRIPPADLFYSMISMIKTHYLNTKKKLNGISFIKNKVVSEKNSVTINPQDELLKYYCKNDKFSDHLIFDIACEAFTLIKKLITSSVKYREFFEGIEQQVNGYRLKYFEPDENLVIYEFLKKIFVHIEIVDESKKGKWETVYFRKLPQFFFLPKDSKENFIQNYDYDSRDSKLESLFNQKDVFMIEMDHNYEYSKNHPIIYSMLSLKSLQRIRRLIFSISLITNIYVIAAYKWDEEGFRAVTPHKEIILTLAIIEFVIGVIVILGWLAFSFKKVFSIELLVFQKEKNFLNKYHQFHYVKCAYVLFQALLNHNDIFNFYLTVLTSLLYFITSSPIWLGLKTIITIFRLSKTAQYVKNSIFLNGRQLLMTLVLGTFFIYCYSLLTIEKFKSDIAPVDTVEGNEDNKFCEDLFVCLLYIFNMGTRNAGIGDILQMQIPDDKAIYVGRFFFDMSFFILINIIILNIIFGIIVDAFGLMRDKAEERLNDLEHFCFICNLTQLNLIKGNVSFDYHNKVEHNKWNYIYYCLYLKKKKTSDYNTLEILIADKIKRVLYDWVPEGSKQFLEKNEEEEKKKNSNQEIKQINHEKLFQDLQEKLMSEIHKQNAIMTDEINRKFENLRNEIKNEIQSVLST